ncbi:MAG: hypothetical protein JWP03_1098 [Phycisphaerales bacterium]|jgi:hypothetical protein|nr:hypothetical protein [Phycisphaerales bacterium]
MVECLEDRRLLSTAVLAGPPPHVVAYNPDLGSAKISPHKNTMQAKVAEEFLAKLGVIHARGIDVNGLQISWGDGNTSEPLLSGSDPVVVEGEHTYLGAGSYKVVVSVGSETQKTLFDDRVVVRGAHGPLSVKTLHAFHVPLPARVSVSEGLSGNIAALTGIPAGISNITTAINWGDGTPPQIAGNSVSLEGNRAYGRHIYQKPGDYLVTARFVNTANGAQLANVVKEHVHVVDTATVGGKQLQAVTGTQFQGVVGTLVMSPAPTDVGIEWGDGTHSHGTLQKIGKDQYQVTASHTYQDPGTYTVRVIGAAGYDPAPATPPTLNGQTIAIQDVGYTGHVVSTMTVSGPSVSPVGPDVRVSAQPVPDQNSMQQFDVTLGTLSDPTDAHNGSLIYGMIDWGVGYIEDHNPYVPVELVNVNGQYEIKGSFEYDIWDAAPKTYTVAISFFRYTGSGVDVLLGTAQTTIKVLPVNTPGGVTLNLQSGVNFSGSVGAVTADEINGGVYPPNSIDWGDGTPPTSTITLTPQSDGTVLVTGSHTYAQAGSYRVVVARVDALGTSQFVMSRAVVS